MKGKVDLKMDMGTERLLVIYIRIRKRQSHAVSETGGDKEARG